MRVLAVAGDVGGFDPAHPSVLTAFAGLLGAALGAVGLWLANRLLGKAAFQTAINDGFAKLTQAQERANETLEERLVAERVAWAAERATFQGEIRNLVQAVESLKAELRRHGIPIPEARISGREAEPGAVILDTPREKP
jgi:hypothetical protein